MLAIVAIPKPNDQQFVLYNDASELLDPANLPRTYIEEADTFIYGSVSLATKAREAALTSAQIARSANRQVIFDVNLRPGLWPKLKEAKIQIEKAMLTATIVKVNEVELEFLTGTRDLTVGCQYLLSKGAELCCISLGEEGSFFSNGKAMGHVPAFEVEVKSTVGSGDAFVAGLAFQLSKLESAISQLGCLELSNFMRFANACGAIVATQEGAMSAELSLQQVNHFIQSDFKA